MARDRLRRSWRRRGLADLPRIAAALASWVGRHDLAARGLSAVVDTYHVGHLIAIGFVWGDAMKERIYVSTCIIDKALESSPATEVGMVVDRGLDHALAEALRSLPGPGS